MLYLEVLVLQVQYMTDSTNGERLVFSSKCGSMDWRCTIKKLGSIGNGRLWMVLLQKHLLGEKSTGPNPTDRAKSGTKRSILVDGKGVPLGVCVDGANRHDMKMTKATLQSIVIYRPDPTIRSKAAHVHGQRLRVSRGIRITGRVWLYNSHQIKR